MIGRLIFFAFAAYPSLVFAHGDGLPIGPDEIWHHWRFDVWIWGPLLTLHWLYGRGVLRAWRRAGFGRIILPARVASFAAGEVILVIALISPLDPLGETLLSAHMVQHLLLAAAAPPLLILGAPATALVWATPASWRNAARWPPVRIATAIWSWLTRPLIATSLHGLAIWLWHIPALFNFALRDDGVHTAEHLSFLFTGLMFAASVLRRDTAPFVGAMLVLATFVHMGVMAAILVLSPTPLYAYGDFAMLWGMSGLSDQQLAGLIMWAPAGGVYLAAFAVVSALLLRAPDASARARMGSIRASTSSRSMK
ncbi:cytochrome c oxidase assembly protein [Terricaulis sp.]|uniref:cytochrome c oxidase assembly protein n=1 Tax=Terricaulis sp. TaxID=2768686 RepID=UPI002AC499C2|nr:cytochrome c oxidase assembly protein [Terricaulis sp.]MDZ4689885.1 cytochrome c oxidase assembly protein [Terricaulis sp.]